MKIKAMTASNCGIYSTQKKKRNIKVKQIGNQFKTRTSFLIWKLKINDHEVLTPRPMGMPGICGTLVTLVGK